MLPLKELATRRGLNCKMEEAGLPSLTAVGPELLVRHGGEPQAGPGARRAIRDATPSVAVSETPMVSW